MSDIESNVTVSSKDDFNQTIVSTSKWFFSILI